jgi:hypothetical protein
MKRHLTIVIASALLLPACDGRGHPSPPATYRLAVEDLVNDETVILKRLSVTTQGSRMVTVNDEGSSAPQARASENGVAGAASSTADILLLADLSGRSPSTPGELMWYVQVRVPSGMAAGGPARSPLAEPKTIKDLVQIHVAPGEHPIGQDLSLGTVQGRRLTLTVR